MKRVVILTLLSVMPTLMRITCELLSSTPTAPQPRIIDHIPACMSHKWLQSSLMTMVCMTGGHKIIMHIYLCILIVPHSSATKDIQFLCCAKV